MITGMVGAVLRRLPQEAQALLSSEWSGRSRAGSTCDHQRQAVGVPRAAG